MATKKTILAAQRAQDPRAAALQQFPALNELGIDNARILSAFLGKVVTAVSTIDANRDGKITALEVLNKLQVIAFEAFVTLPGMSLKTALAELRDANNDERQQLLLAFAEKFQLNNVEAEWLLEDWLFWLEEGITLAARTKRLFAKPVQEEPVG
jgi:hypothetical protein